MPGSQVSLLCPFCAEEFMVVRGAFPFVSSQLLVKFERCKGLPPGTSSAEIHAAAEGIADEIVVSGLPRFALVLPAQLATIVSSNPVSAT